MSFATSADARRDAEIDRARFKVALNNLKGKDARKTLALLDTIRDSLRELSSGTTTLTRSQWVALDKAHDAIDWILK